MGSPSFSSPVIKGETRNSGCHQLHEGKLMKQIEFNTVSNFGCLLQNLSERVGMKASLFCPIVEVT